MDGMSRKPLNHSSKTQVYKFWPALVLPQTIGFVMVLQVLLLAVAATWYPHPSLPRPLNPKPEAPQGTSQMAPEAP